MTQQTDTDSSSLLAELRRRLPEAVILTAEADIAPFCIDQRRRYEGRVWAVVQPRTVAEVQTVVRFCRQYAVPLTPQGGNTSLCGGATPGAAVAGQGIIVSLSKLNRLRALSVADQAITVEAGMTLQAVQQAAAAAGRLFPLSMASEGSCQIGGNIACNAGGLNVLRYGTARDLVLGLEVVLPDGTLVSQLAPLHKNTTGFDLKQLLIGSEGTLGIITAATLKLFALPQTTVTAWVGVDSIQAAVALLALLQGEFAERLSSFELISEYALTLSSRFSGLPAPLDGQAWHVLLELSDAQAHTDLADALVDGLLAHGFTEAVLAQSQQQAQDFWTLREHISEAQRHLGASIKHDIAVPIAAVAACVTEAAARIHSEYPQAQVVVFGHLGDGSLHYNVFLPDVPDQHIYAHEARLNHLVYTTVLAHQGTIAAEHGIGQLKRAWLAQVRQPAEIEWMRHVKHYWDAADLFNRGKLLPDPD